MAARKYSRQREAIKQSLAGRTDHPTAEKLYSELHESDPKLSLGTVYRNLALLAEMGEIRKISTLIGPDHFDGNTSMHYHFICRDCHEMSDIWTEETEHLSRQITETAEGEVEEIELVAYGICRSCRDRLHQKMA